MDQYSDDEEEDVKLEPIDDQTFKLIFFSICDKPPKEYLKVIYNKNNKRIKCGS